MEPSTFGMITLAVALVQSAIFSAALIVIFVKTGHSAEWALFGLMPFSAVCLSPLIAVVLSWSLELGDRNQVYLFTILNQSAPWLISFSGVAVLAWRVARPDAHRGEANV